MDNLEKKIREVFKEIETTDGITPSRNFTIYTGSAGVDDLNRALLIENVSGLSDWLKEKNHITEANHKGLQEMLHSSDEESVILAIEIIKTKHNTYEISI